MAKRIATRKTRSVVRRDLPAKILRSLPQHVIVTNLDGRIEYWNSAAAADFGYSAAEARGSMLSLIYPAAQMKQMRRDVDAVLGGHEFSGEWEGLHKQGSRVWVDIHVTVLKNAGGRPSHIMRVGRNITSQKHAQEAERHREPLYRALGDAVDYGVWGCDSKGRLTHMSDSFLKLLGLTSDQNISDGWLNALHPEEREPIMEAWRQCFAAAKPWNRRYRIRGADNRYHEILTHAAPVIDINGEIICWAGLNLDANKLK
jgi:PAS domain S-box-containing protein